MFGLIAFFGATILLAVPAAAIHLTSEAAREIRKKQYFGKLDIRSEEPFLPDPRVIARPIARFRKPSWQEG